MNPKILLLVFPALFLAQCSARFAADKRLYRDGYRFETVKQLPQTESTNPAGAKAARKNKPEAPPLNASYSIDDAALDNLFANAEEQHSPALAAAKTGNLHAIGKVLPRSQKIINKIPARNPLLRKILNNDKNNLPLLGMILGLSAVAVTAAALFVPYVGGLLMVLGVLAAVAAIIVSNIALRKIKSDPAKYTGRGMALTGLISGIALLVIDVLLLILLLLAVVLIFGALGNACANISC